ncbi:hypothetical protein PCANC_06810 [Puccinia coronata f. sp. avenae]|uniref:Uncharacterized protein n=1 Tax=Puccinia coronata f. sp. avenae TaxID=200324 RepID=A0A2N5UGT3_9BASI|nr:hypothetical protein PCANC_08018 [Puccinia coronata f. sp. avenae]PLW36962.1 hypothetical protein PCASD_06671 [Puccinia coronata f. sp. avenae]PLW41267.1 hypothetical protein PCANC_06810 [Puccinia coronata f. sp. avenae]
MKSSSSTTSSSTLNNEKKTPALEPNKIDTMIRARQINHQSKISTIQRKLPSSQPDSTINSSTVSCRKTLSKPRSFNNTIAPVNRRTHLKGSLSNGNQNELQGKNAYIIPS